MEYYLAVRQLHIALVIASGSLFAFRGLLMLYGSPLRDHVVLRRLSHLIDTALLAAALLLMYRIGQYPLTHDWLTVKIIGVVLYIVLGVFALRRGRSRRVRAICFLAALAVFAFVWSVARAHHPAGLLLLLV